MFSCFFKLLRDPCGISKIDRCVLCFGKQNQRLAMAERFFTQTKIVNAIEDVCWSDILLRRVRFLNRPEKEFVKNRSDYWKRRLIGWLDLMVGAELAFYSLREQIFENHGRNVLFSPAKSTTDIYKVHLPHFKVVDIKDEQRDWRIWPFYFLTRILCKKFVDDEDGVTVFANPSSKWSIKAYKLAHPKKKIIVRFHDRIADGMSIPSKKVYSIIQDLKRNQIIDGVESYFRGDAEKLEGIYRPNGVNSEKVLELNVPYRKALYSFSGSPASLTERNKRYLPLIPVSRKIFELYPEISEWLGAGITTFSKKWVPYEEFMRKSALSEIYIDLYRMGPDEGFSYRIPEALWLNRKIISNRLILEKESFYSKDRIFLIGKDDLSRLKEFLETEISPLPSETLKQFDSLLWWTESDPYSTFKK